MTGLKNGLAVLMVAALASGLTACGDGNDDYTDPGDVTAPTVTAVTPVDGATDVDRSSLISATFNEDMLYTTINDTTFLVTGVGILTGTVSYDGSTRAASFVPDNPLPMLATLTARLTPDVSDLSGNGLDESVSWTFATGEGAWGSAAVIEEYSAGDAITPQVAMDSKGNGLAVWVQSDGVRNNIWASHYIYGSGWEVPELIETGAYDAMTPQVAMDANGNGVAVWAQSDNTVTSIWSNIYTAGSGWEVARSIETNNTGNAFDPQVAIDAVGNAVVVWAQTYVDNPNPTRDRIWSNRFAIGRGWSGPVLVDVTATGDASQPQVAVYASGSALAVWTQFDGTQDSIWASRYVAGMTWGAPTPLETDNANAAQTPQIAADGRGNAVAVWVQNNNIYANRYAARAGWGDVVLVDGEATSASSPQVAMDSQGNATVVWTQSDGSFPSIASNRFDATSGWGTAAFIESTGDTAGAAQIALDATGNGLAVWSQSDGTRDNVWANRFVPATGWSATPTLIETDNATAATPQIAINSVGNALSVWSQSDGARESIWSNRFE